MSEFVKIKSRTLANIYNSIIIPRHLIGRCRFWAKQMRLCTHSNLMCRQSQKFLRSKSIADVCCQEHASNTLPCLAVEKKFHDVDVVGYKESGTCRSSLHCLSCLAIAKISLNFGSATAHPLQGWILTRSTLVVFIPGLHFFTLNLNCK